MISCGYKLCYILTNQPYHPRQFPTRTCDGTAPIDSAATAALIFTVILLRTRRETVPAARHAQSQGTPPTHTDVASVLLFIAEGTRAQSHWETVASLDGRCCRALTVLSAISCASRHRHRKHTRHGQTDCAGAGCDQWECGSVSDGTQYKWKPIWQPFGSFGVPLPVTGIEDTDLVGVTGEHYMRCVPV
jgi:hypothetical protein